MSLNSQCYLCGEPATHPLVLQKTFTAHSSCKAPSSDKMCDRCNTSINGTEKMLWYWNENKNQWSRLWGRSLSRLYQGKTLMSPVITGEHTEKNLTLPIVSSLATRIEIRQWLLDPPEPPFTIAIAESGQKHILPWAQEGYSRDHFPVQFELDSLWISRNQLKDVLSSYETLMTLGFSKTEINSGDYHSDRLMAALLTYEPHEEKVAQHRGSRFLQLVSHVAQHING
jgi:hypothetical protein